MICDSTWLTNPKYHHRRLFAGGHPRASFKSSPAVNYSIEERIYDDSICQIAKK